MKLRKIDCSGWTMFISRNIFSVTPERLDVEHITVEEKWEIKQSFTLFCTEKQTWNAGSEINMLQLKTITF